MGLFSIILFSAIMLSGIMALAWYVAEKTGNSGWVDMIWSFAVGIVGLFAIFVPYDGAEDFTARQLLVGGLVAAWSLRLGGYIAVRSSSGHDDPRYAHLRKQWGDEASKRLFTFLQIQAAAALLLVVTIMAAARNPAPGLGAFDVLGLIILGISIAGAALSDQQLAAFKKDPNNKGEVCNVGLWGRSRHPNYFFEWLGWVAYIPFALNFSGDYWFGLLAIAGPIFMYWLLVHVSGIPLLEEHMVRSRGDKYRAYQREVSAFWPSLKSRTTQHQAA